MASKCHDRVRQLMTEQYANHDRPFWPMSPEVRADAEHFLGLRDAAELPRPVGLLVGEQPPAGGNPRLPLWSWPKNCAGARLFRMSGMSVDDYLTRLARVNLHFGPTTQWCAGWARSRAEDLLASLPAAGTRVVACGVRARDAFGLAEWFTPADAAQGDLAVPEDFAQVVAVPHPSGRSRAYNDQAARDECGRWVRWAARVDLG